MIRRLLVAWLILCGSIYVSQAWWQSVQQNSVLTAGAAVTVDACSTAGLATNTTIDNNAQTIAGGLNKPALLMALSVSNTGIISSVTANWDALGTPQAMTALGNASSLTQQVYLFGLRNPTSGNKRLTASWTTTAQLKMFVCSFSNVDTSSDGAAFPNFGSATNAAPIAKAVTSGASDIVWAAFGSAANFTSTNGAQPTGFIDNTGSTWAIAADYKISTGASTTISGSPGSAITALVAAVDVAAAP